MMTLVTKHEVKDGDLSVVASFTPTPRAVSTGGPGRRSPFDVKLEKIAGDSSLHGQHRLIQQYGSVDSARQTLGTLRRKYGWDSAAYGWDIAMGDVGDGLYSIVAKHDPSAIVDGAADAHVVKVEESKRKRVTAVPNGSNEPLSEGAVEENVTGEVPVDEGGNGHGAGRKGKRAEASV